MPNPPETHYTRAGSGELAYQVMGDGPLDLIFVPTWESNVDVIWENPLIRRFLLRLASFSRLIVFDKRGTGVSGPIPEGATPTLEQWTDDVGAVLDEVGSRQAALFGQGAGGQMAMLFAASHPERSSALVLLDSHARFVRAPDYPAGLPEHRVQPFLDGFLATWGTGANVWTSSGATREIQWYARLQRLAMSPRMATAAFESVVINTDVRSTLDLIGVPALVLHRRENQFIRIGHGRYAAEHIRGAKLVEIDGDDFMYWLGDTETILNETEEFLTGRLTDAETDRVLATVLFTDIVESTQQAAALGDRRWGEMLDAHDNLARAEVLAFRGQLIKSTGDGLLATFDGPARAVRAANSIRSGLRSIGIEVRSGIHTGEIEMRGDDVAGLGVHIAARVQAAAQPGEVLVSRTVTDLVAGSGLEFADRGSHELKGVPGTWQLFSLTSP